MKLGDYLTAATRQHWLTGERDCCTFPGDWALTWGRGDAMAEWRGRYSTDAEALRFVNSGGGLAALWRQGLSSIGIGEVARPRVGDIGVILAVGADRQPAQVGAIWTGRRWAFRAESGLFFASAEIVQVWGPR